MISSRTPDPIIETVNLTRRFGGREAVNGLSFTVPRGAVYGLLGLNGAGKSTTIRMLMGLIHRDGGTAQVLGLDPARAKDAVEIKRRVGYVAETPAFYDWMTVSDLCAFVAHYRRAEWDGRRADDLIHRFRLPHDVKVKNLSKGQRAKTALVLALAFGPELLILDEPTSGLDPVARREFVEGMLGEFQESGKTIFISSHLVNELSGLIDTVGVISEGRMLYSGPSDAFAASVRRVRVAFAGPAPADLSVEGMTHRRVMGREAVLSVRQFDEPRVLAQLRAADATSIDIEALNLEDAFVEFMCGEDKDARDADGARGRTLEAVSEGREA